MTIPEITQLELEKWVPGFTNPDSEVFNMIKPFIDAEKYRLELFIGNGVKLKGVDVFDETFDVTFDEDPQIYNIQRDVLQVVCLRGARQAIPHLDLTLTAQGFGVIRNDMTVPASKERVDALKEQIRINESEAWDRLRLNLCYHTTWAGSDSAKNEINSLLWCPTLVRRYGVTYGGKYIYEDEYRAVLPKINAMEVEVASIISPALYDAIVEKERAEQDPGSPYYAVKEKCRKMIAYLVNNPADRYFQRMREDLIETLRRFSAQLPEYGQSSTSKSYEHERYQNRKEDHCFFFGV